MEPTSIQPYQEGTAVFLGLVLGLVVGALARNLSFGLCLGVGLGAVIDGILRIRACPPASR